MNSTPKNQEEPSTSRLRTLSERSLSASSTPPPHTHEGGDDEKSISDMFKEAMARNTKYVAEVDGLKKRNRELEEGIKDFEEVKNILKGLQSENKELKEKLLDADHRAKAYKEMRDSEKKVSDTLRSLRLHHSDKISVIRQNYEAQIKAEERIWAASEERAVRSARQSIAPLRNPTVKEDEGIGLTLDEDGSTNEVTHPVSPDCEGKEEKDKIEDDDGEEEKGDDVEVDEEEKEDDAEDNDDDEEEEEEDDVEDDDDQEEKEDEETSPRKKVKVFYLGELNHRGRDTPKKFKCHAPGCNLILRGPISWKNHVVHHLPTHTSYKKGKHTYMYSVCPIKNCYYISQKSHVTRHMLTRHAGEEVNTAIKHFKVFKSALCEKSDKYFVRVP